MLRDTAPALAHDLVVIPRKYRGQKRGEQVHPAFSRGHGPCVLHAGGFAEVAQLPASGSGQVAGSNALDGSRPRKRGGPHLETETIRKPARPRVTPERADALCVAFLELDHCFDVSPPARPLLGGDQSFPDPLDRRLEDRKSTRLNSSH